MFIVVTGPESCGKTEMSEYLGMQLPAFVVKEHARSVLAGLGRQYVLSDIVEIGRVQYDAVRQAMDARHGIIVSDTFMLELTVWTEVRFEGEPDEVAFWRKALKPDIYVLCNPDIPWEADPYRENPHDRDVLFEHYLRYIEQSGIPFIRAVGTGAERMRSVEQELRKLIEKNIP